MRNRSHFHFSSEIYIGGIIFLCFLLTGSAYISWLYHLTDLFGSSQADILSEGIGYIFQAIGMLIFALLVKYKRTLVKNPHFLSASVILDGIMIVLALLMTSKKTVLIFGLMMNLFHGIIAGYYLTKLSLYVPQQKKSTVFGTAYALGSIGTWVLSLFLKNTFLHSNLCLIAYLFLIICINICNHFSKQEEVSDEVNLSSDFQRPQFALIICVLILLSVVKGLGFYFPMSASVNGSINLEFSRAFYAVGLITAGIISDRNRKYGAICCLAALIFPFVSFALNGYDNISSILWILGYVFFGFFSVYRVTVFCDIAAKKDDLVWMAGFGLLFGRIGDALETMTGTLLEGQDIVLVLITAGLFIITVVLFFQIYHILYVPVLSQQDNEEKLLNHFEIQYSLSARECEVFRLAVKGRSNAEIAGDLYISESTVKFHMKNVLKKTECANRTELTMRFKQLS